MIAARTISGAAYLEMIEEIGRELTEVIEDFDRAMIFEALANNTSKLHFFSLSIVGPQGVWRRACRARASRASRARAKRTRMNRARASRARASKSRAFVQAS